jgi:AsmA protein
VIKPIHITWTKGIILVLAIIPILVFLAFAGAVSLIDFNQYKPQIEAEVTQYTNRDFKIEGEVDVSILPFKFHLGNLALKNPQGFKETNLMTMKGAHIELSLKSLFIDRKLDIKGLELIEPKLHFIQQKTQNNWSDIPLLAAIMPEQQLAKLRYANLKPNEVTNYFKRVVSDVNSGPPIVKPEVNEQDWSLQSLVVKNAQIDYSNIEDGYTVTIKKVNLLTFDVLPNTPFQINTDFVYQHSQSPRTFDFELNGFLQLGNHYSQLYLNNWNGVFRLQLPSERNLPDIRLTTSGKNLLLDFKHHQIYVNEATLQGLEADVNLSFQGEFGVNPVFEGVFEANKINLKEWVKRLGLPAPEMVNKKSLTEAEGKFNWRWDGKVLKLDKIQAKLDSTSIQGNVLLPLDFNQALQFNLAIDGLKAEDYLAKVTELNKETGQKVEHTFYPLPLKALQALNAQGNVVFTNFNAFDIRVDKLESELFSRQGKMVFAPFDWQVKDGVLQSKLIADVSKSLGQYLWKGRTKNLPINALVSNVKSSLTGNVESHFHLTTFGNTPEAWTENLKGVVNANISDAEVYGLDMNALLAGNVSLNKTDDLHTKLNHVEVNGKFLQGVFTPKRLLVQSENFKGAGKGTFDLKRQQVNGELQVTIEKTDNVLTELKGLTLPLMFKGDLTQPTWSVNLAEITPGLLTQAPILNTLKTMIE